MNTKKPSEQSTKEWLAEYLYYETLGVDMPLIVKDNPSNFELPPEGTHIARCYQVIDLGEQQTSFGPKRKILVNFELPNELMADGRPFSVGNRYTPSLNEKAILRQHLESWRGKAFTEGELEGFDIFKVLGHPAMVSVVHSESNGKNYANIKSVTALPRGMECPPAVNKFIAFNTEDYDKVELDLLPEWLHKVIVFPDSRSEPASPDEGDQFAADRF